MAEHQQVDPQQLHHFISVSDWDAKGVMDDVAAKMEQTFSGCSSAKGLYLDETSWKKKGDKSVGVGRQYLGSEGKVENGQVVVFAALGQQTKVGLVEAELFLPKEWTQNETRLKQAGVPKERWHYKSKAELALEMVSRLQGKLSYDYIAADSIYGSSEQLRKGLCKLGKLFVMDISIKQKLYLQAPMPWLPQTKPGKGRPVSKYVSEQQSLTVEELIGQLPAEQWQRIAYRKGSKGWLQRQAAVVEVYLWKQGSPAEQVEHYRLLLSRNLEGEELKYSLVNDVEQPKDLEQLLYFRMQRYWVERAFQETKQQLGMAQYQIRGWKALYHHLALSMMALHYIIEQQVEKGEQIPLLSAADVKMAIAHQLIQQMNQEQIMELILKRNQKRQQDINRYYKT